jgi:glycosyltransferase involved in cell wall biosynthesis
MESVVKILGWPAFRAAQNPYTVLLYRSLQARGIDVTEYSVGQALRGRYDILHLHWPNFEWPKQRTSWHRRLKLLRHALNVPMVLLVARLRKRTIVWSVHNAMAHDARFPQLAQWYDRMLSQLVHGHLSFSAHALRTVLSRFPHLKERPYAVVRHGHYRSAYPPRAERAAARQRLSIPADAKVLLFIGSIRPYKQVEALIRCMQTMHDPDVFLLLAGPPSSEAVAQRISSQMRQVHGLAQLRHIEEEELPVLFGAADLFVYPATPMLSSGSLLLSLSYAVPVLAADSDAARDARDLFGSDAVMCNDGELTSEQINQALTWATIPRAKETFDTPLQAIEWTDIAAETEEAFHTILRQRKSVDRDRGEGLLGGRAHPNG